MENKDVGEVTIVDDMAVAINLTRIRNEETETPEFMEGVEAMAPFLLAEAMKYLEYTEARVTTPLGVEASGTVLRGKVGLVPVMRAGAGLLMQAKTLIGNGNYVEGEINIQRNEETLEPEGNGKLNNLPPELKDCQATFLLEVMLATGGSMVESVRMLKELGVDKVVAVAIIAAPEGIVKVQENHPDVSIVVAAVDEYEEGVGLNDKGYIVPGLGDAGDRLFGVKE